MSLLRSVEGTELTEYVIKLANNQKIYKVIEFLETNNVKLSKIINLPTDQVIKLKDLLVKESCPSLHSAAKIYKELTNSSPFLTGIKSLDELLNGEITYRNNLIEICGLTGSGKSFTCSTIALNLAQNYNFETLYIDTKNDFSGSRTYKFLQARNLSGKQIGTIMQKIYVERVYNAKGVLEILKKLMLVENESFLKTLKLIIIDSLPSVWFLYHGEKSIEGISLLVEASNMLRKLSKDYGVMTLAVNLVTRWVEYEIEQNICERSQTTIKPSLGQYWDTVPTLRLMIAEDDITSSKSSLEKAPAIGLPSSSSSSSSSLESSFQNQREIKILKSNCYETGKSCVVRLTEQGTI